MLKSRPSNKLTFSEFNSELDYKFNEPELKRSSINAIFSLFSEKDEEVADDLSKTQRILRTTREKISHQNKKKFALETRLQTLIVALKKHKDDKTLIQKLKKSVEFEYDSESTVGCKISDEQLEKFGFLIFELQTNPNNISKLLEFNKSCQLDFLIETITFSLFGRQFDSRQEHLLLLVVKNLLTSSINGSNDSYNMMRGNSPLTKLMATYTRRGQCQDYLRTVLSDVIQSIVDKVDCEDDFELNSHKIYKKLVLQNKLNPSQFVLENGFDDLSLISQNETIIEIVRERTQKIIEITTLVINTIFDNIDQVPFGIRWICKQISCSFSQKNKKFENLNPLLLVGGFFFLRFINPSLINPLIFLQAESNILDKSKKLLLLIAKTIQMLANKTSLEHHISSDYYGAYNCQTVTNECHFKFFDDYCERKNSFLAELCNVDDFNDLLTIEHYSFLISEPQSMDFTARELFCLHSSFLSLIKDYPDSYPSRIKDIVYGISESELKIDSNEDFKVSLVLNSKCKLDSKLELIAKPGNISNLGLITIEAKSILVLIIRSIPEIFNSIIDKFYHNPEIYNNQNNFSEYNLELFDIAKMAATSSKDVKLVKWGIKATDLLTQINSKSRNTFEQNSWKRNLSEQIISELIYLNGLKSRLDNDLVNLVDIYTNIINHNKFLETQLIHYQTLINSLSKNTYKKQPGSFFSFKKKSTPLLSPNMISPLISNSQLTFENESKFPIHKSRSTEFLNAVSHDRKSIDTLKSPKPDNSQTFASYSKSRPRKIIMNTFGSKFLSNSPSAEKFDQNKPSYSIDMDSSKTLNVNIALSPFSPRKEILNTPKSNPALHTPILPQKVPIYTSDGLVSYSYTLNEMEKLKVINIQNSSFLSKKVPKSANFKFASPFSTVYYLDIFNDDKFSTNLLHVSLVRDDLVDRKKDNILSFDIGFVSLNIERLILLLDYLYPSSE
ncbi:GTPase-activating protein [Smittium culicis]|uniref:GTPase-activating protein n=1 Tax=Smittium culicis TaxID=133412 RepID=A0A1R1X9B1_9FUNG|nr:GTPase-activating protein [Smittium culicis]OMJ11223.1 GTPase-activating protein [Smittium culicis]